MTRFLFAAKSRLGIDDAAIRRIARRIAHEDGLNIRASSVGKPGIFCSSIAAKNDKADVAKVAQCACMTICGNGAET